MIKQLSHEKILNLNKNIMSPKIKTLQSYAYQGLLSPQPFTVKHFDIQDKAVQNQRRKTHENLGFLYSKHLINHKKSIPEEPLARKRTPEFKKNVKQQQVKQNDVFRRKTFIPYKKPYKMTKIQQNCPKKSNYSSNKSDRQGEKSQKSNKDVRRNVSVKEHKKVMQKTKGNGQRASVNANQKKKQYSNTNLFNKGSSLRNIYHENQVELPKRNTFHSDTLIQSFGPSQKNEFQTGEKQIFASIVLQNKSTLISKDQKQKSIAVKNQKKPKFIPQKSIISEFIIVKLIGNSKISQSYLCVDRKSHTVYCLKKINKQMLKQNPQLLQQFVKKIKLRMLSVHQHIVQIYHIFYDQSFVYVLEQFMEGGTLNQYLESFRIVGSGDAEFQISQTFVAEKIYNINSALQYIHHHQISDNFITTKVHGNLRPQTIFINIGICKLKPVHPSQIKNQNIEYNPYLCPETVITKSITSKSDMWSLGLISLQLCLKRRLFMKVSNKLLLLKQVQTCLMELKNKESISNSLKDLVCNLLKVSPSQRYNCSQVMINSAFEALGFTAQEKRFKNLQSNQPIKQKYIKIQQKPQQKINR